MGGKTCDRTHAVSWLFFPSPLFSQSAEEFELFLQQGVAETICFVGTESILQPSSDSRITLNLIGLET